MQKINIILPALFLASFYLQAAQEVPAVSILMRRAINASHPRDK